MSEGTVFRLDDVATIRGAGADHVHPLDGVTASLRGGVVTVVVGPSGSGKSTLLRLLNRMEEPSHGTVRFHDRPVSSYDVLALRRRVGLVLQLPTPFPGTVLDNLRAGAPELPEPTALELLDRVALPVGFLHRDTSGLSGGEAQRVCLARALAVGPEVLLLDEPTSALDRFAGLVVEQSLRRCADDGTTVVLVSHDLAQARRIGDDLLVVHSGSVVAQGRLADVLADPGDARAAAFLREVS